MHLHQPFAGFVLSCVFDRALADAQIIHLYDWHDGRRPIRWTFTSGLSHEDVPEWAWIIYPRTLRRAIYQHRSTLRVLNLDLDIQLAVPGQAPDTSLNPDESISEDSDYEEESSDNEPYTQSVEQDQDHQLAFPTVSSLRNFPALTHLCIGIKLLLGSPEDIKRHPSPVTFCLVHNLPQNLQRLGLPWVQGMTPRHYPRRVRLARLPDPGPDGEQGGETSVPAGSAWSV